MQVLAWNVDVGASSLATAVFGLAMTFKRKPLVWERPLAATGVYGPASVVLAF
jgi:hypothetical protein